MITDKEHKRHLKQFHKLSLVLSESPDGIDFRKNDIFRYDELDFILF